MYARRMSTREIQGHLRGLYGLEVSPGLVSAVTDAVLDEVAGWQNRPLEALCPVVFLDALRVKVRDEGTVRNKAVYVALGVRPDGTEEVLGLWVEQTEGAKSYVRAIEGRVAAAARAQTLLADDRWAGADLATLLRGALAASLQAGTRPRRA